MKSALVEQAAQKASKWDRLKGPLLRYAVPIAGMSGLVATLGDPNLERSLPLHDTVGPLASYSVGYFGGLTVGMVAKWLEDRESKPAAKVAKAVSWAGPIAVQLGGNISSMPWSVGRSLPGVAVGVGSVVAGIMTGRHSADNGLVDNTDISLDFNELEQMLEANSPEVVPETVADSEARVMEFRPFELYIANPTDYPAPYASDKIIL